MSTTRLANGYNMFLRWLSLVLFFWLIYGNFRYDSLVLDDGSQAGIGFASTLPSAMAYCHFENRHNLVYSWPSRQGAYTTLTAALRAEWCELQRVLPLMN